MTAVLYYKGLLVADRATSCGGTMTKIGTRQKLTFVYDRNKLVGAFAGAGSSDEVINVIEKAEFDEDFSTFRLPPKVNAPSSTIIYGSLFKPDSITFFSGDARVPVLIQPTNGIFSLGTGGDFAHAIAFATGNVRKAMRTAVALNDGCAPPFDWINLHTQKHGTWSN